MPTSTEARWRTPDPRRPSNWQAVVRFGLLGLLGPGAAIQAQAPPGWRTDFTRHSVPLEEIVPGGPPKDGIPAIDRPRFESTREAARWLRDREPVMVVEHVGDARAYPLQILIWHEIVNDVVGGAPVAVTYCPLCHTAIAFHRRLLAGDTTSFGTTGWLRLSDMVMYDRATESWWQQATGEGLVGVHAGARLERAPSTLVSFGEFRRQHPGGRVLSRETGFRRDYGRSPYARYDAAGSSPIAAFFGRRPDGRLPPMERVVIVRGGDSQVVVPFSHLERERVVITEVDGEAVAVFWSPGTASSMDAGVIAEGRDVGSATAFRARVDDRVLRFEASGADGFRDRDTGSTWTLLGRATAGPLAGRRLEPVDHGAYFWFAVAAFWPDARLHAGPPR